MRRPDREPSMSVMPEASVHTATIPNISKLWENALHLARKQVYPQGHYLTLDRESRADFYYLGEGRISILHGAANGQVQNMLYVEEGNLFNVAAVLGSALTPYEDPGTQFYCLKTSAIWRFPGAVLQDEDFIRRYPALIANLMASLGVKLLIMHNTLSNAGTGDAVTRICRFALNLSRAHGGADVLEPNISQNEMANLFGMHRATLLRALRALKQDGVIMELTRSRLVIGDREALRRLALK